MQLRDFLRFLSEYARSRLLEFGKHFENIKSILVAILVVKRGKYSSSFLNTSFLLLVLAAVVAGPIIADNNPFVPSLQPNTAFQAAVVSYDPNGGSLGTIISAKPRDKVVEYEIQGGDTLASIAKKFGVSVDSIKWASNLKSDTIKPGESLKIPPVSGVVHKVVAGDTVYAIAKKYGTDAQKIVNFPFNDFVDLDTFSLTPGQTLIVPDGVPPEEQPRFAPPQYAQVQVGVKGSSNFIWPTTGSISQYPIWYHMAVDIQNPSAPPVIAADTGTVVFAGCLGYGYGCHVIINHANGYETLYGHMSKILVSAGEAVNQGQQIGVMGCTGRCTGTHLHFEVRSGGVQLNPLNFLK